jgi:hypothetical protein
MALTAAFFRVISLNISVDRKQGAVYSVSMIYKIYESNLGTLEKKLARLNAKLTRIGAQPVTHKVTGHEDVASEDKEGLVERYLLLEVEGTAPKYNGWNFLATLVHTQEGNVIRSVPGFEAPVDYRDRLPVCDHCKTARNRHDTYIVRHDDGRTMQVGSTCMRDFLATEPGRLTNAAQILFECYSICESAKSKVWLGGNSKHVPYRIDLDTYLGWVATVVLKENRYITRRMVMDQKATKSTAQIAYDEMTHSYITPLYTVTPEAEKLASEARSFVLKKFSPAIMDVDSASDDAIMANVLNSLKAPNNNLNDFEHNLLACARAEAIEPRLTGIAAYIVEYYRKNNQPEPARQGPAVLNATGLPRIFGMFQKAGEHLKRPGIRLMDTASKSHLYLSLAGAQSANAGCIYVKGPSNSDAYYGKITPAGKFFAARGCPATVETQLLAFATDPETVAKNYGKLTGKCCFCGRPLCDERSTDVGYGPVCADKFGLNWGVRNEFLAGHRAVIETQAARTPVQAQVAVA